MTEPPRPGQRIAVRYRDDSGPRELIGYVRAFGPEGLAMLDRTLAARLVPTDRLESWRVVPQVPRGRNPLAADRVLLDRMATDPRLDLPGAAPYATGGQDAADDCLVARLADLLGPAVPDQGPEAYDLGEGIAAYAVGDVRARALVVGEWATIRLVDDRDDPSGDSAEQVVRGLARWAAYRDARNVQVRGTGREPAGFSRLRRT